MYELDLRIIELENENKLLKEEVKKLKRKHKTGSNKKYYVLHDKVGKSYGEFDNFLEISEEYGVTYGVLRTRFYNGYPLKIDGIYIDVEQKIEGDEEIEG